jgi:glucan endo-1,3-alpha-glucosidase
MVGGISEAHVRQDIVDAKALGLDGFALNYGIPHPSLAPPIH